MIQAFSRIEATKPAAKVRLTDNEAAIAHSAFRSDALVASSINATDEQTVAFTVSGQRAVSHIALEDL